MDKKVSSELRETRSYNAKHEARDAKGRFTAGMKGHSEKKAASDKSAMPGKNAGDCKCTSTLGSSYADEKYREGRSWDETRDSGKHNHKHGHDHDHKQGHRHDRSNMGNDDTVEVITITSYFEK